MDNMADLNDEIADINEVCSCGCSLCAWAVVCFVRACVIVLREAISTTYAVPDGFDEAPIMGCLRTARDKGPFKNAHEFINRLVALA